MIDYSGLMEVVTLKSPSGVLHGCFLHLSNLFFATFSIIGDLFVLPRYCVELNLIN